MKHFLVVYNRREGHIVRHHGYHGSSSALAARFEAEREFRGQPDIEVVVLGAESWEALPRTHARYFKDVPELAEAALGQVRGES